MSKCIVKILRDETPGGLAEKINKELEKNTRSWDTVTGIKYQVAVIPIMRGKEIAGFKTEYSALIPGVMNLGSEELNMEKYRNGFMHQQTFPRNWKRHLRQ